MPPGIPCAAIEEFVTGNAIWESVVALVPDELKNLLAEGKVCWVLGARILSETDIKEDRVNFRLRKPSAYIPKSVKTR